MLQPFLQMMHRIAQNNRLDTINLYSALQRMRELTKAGIPFSFEHITYNSTTNRTEGVRKVSSALLRTGMSQEYSDKSQVLIGYSIEPIGDYRWFYLPLLMKFNGMNVTP